MQPPIRYAKVDVIFLFLLVSDKLLRVIICRYFPSSSTLSWLFNRQMVLILLEILELLLRDEILL